MKKINFLSSIILFILLPFLSSSCHKESSDPYSLEINKFIWEGLNSYYLWVDSVPKLSPSYFQNNSNNLNNFLNGYSDHEKLFNDLLYSNLDHWSWIEKDYTVLDNELQGISKSFGFEFRLSIYGGTNSTSVLGFVIYVLKGSPAEKAGLKRGDIFIKVDGQSITVDNYQSLLFNKDSYKLSMAYVSNNTLYPKNQDISLTAIEMQEDPVFMDTVYNINNHRIGYLVYNGFYPDFDNELNNSFKKFKDAGIQDLILDLRYNGGGSIQSAINLASMIYSTDNTKVFVTTKYNTALQFYLSGKYGNNFFIEHFVDTIARNSNYPAPAQINSLGLNQLYVITSGNTASASELVINGLKPYINVITIGTNTVGKYVGSITLKDYDSNGVINPHHKWAMQPIVLKLANKDGVSDYKNGFAPKDTVRENIANLLPFGDTNEPLLKAALNEVQGLPQQASLLKTAPAYRTIADSKDFKPHGKEMYKNLGTRIRPGDLH